MELGLWGRTKDGVLYWKLRVVGVHPALGFSRGTEQTAIPILCVEYKTALWPYFPGHPSIRLSPINPPSPSHRGSIT